MLKQILLLFLLFVGLQISAQTIDLERIQTIDFKTQEDYSDFEDELILYVDWLENNSINHTDRIKVNAIILKWAEGTAAVTISIDSYLMNYIEKNPAFMVLFIGSWSRYVLQNPQQNDNQLACNLAGVNAFLDFYQKGKEYGVVKDKKVEKLLKKRRSKKLEKWLDKKVN